MRITRHMTTTADNMLYKRFIIRSGSMSAETGQRDEQMTIIHTTPVMADDEKQKAKKRIGNDLYVIFSRIQEQLKSESVL